MVAKALFLLLRRQPYTQRNRWIGACCQAFSFTYKYSTVVSISYITRFPRNQQQNPHHPRNLHAPMRGGAPVQEGRSKPHG